MDEPKTDAPKNENTSDENESHNLPPVDAAVGEASTEKPVEQAGEAAKPGPESVDRKITESGSTEANSEFSVKPAISKPTKKSPKMLLLLLIVVLIAAGIGFYFYSKSNSKPAISVSTTTPAPAPVQQTSDGNTFEQAPVKLGDLNFFKDTSVAFGMNCTGNQTTNCPPLAKPTQLQYYQIGMTKSKQPIVVVNYDSQTNAGNVTFYAIKSSNGSYHILGKFSPTGKLDATFTKSLNTNVSVDATTDLPELYFPKNVTIKGLSLSTYGTDKKVLGSFINGVNEISSGGVAGLTTPNPPQITKIGSQDGIDYYDAVTNDKPYYQVKAMRGAIGGINALWYQLKTPLVDPNNPGDGTGKHAYKIKWTNGQTNAADYGYGTGSCGDSGGYVVTKNMPVSQLIKAGVAPDGAAVYQVPTTSGLFKAYYDNYFGKTPFLAEVNKSILNLPAAGYQAQHALIVMKNTVGEYMVYSRSDMTPGGGCGKPVIYLYPQKSTNVDVSVGANITKSDPLYSSYGWQNVLAQPNGTLTYQGKTYDSLYWEGKGNGMYPLLGAGTVVPHARVVSTIKSQLAEQGLKPHEISDFLAFWQPKLPNTPYTRLTWIGTDDMNQLAPLQITPKPQTVIRTFLDFQGLDRPMQIATQSFTAPQRNGFTVVEWGGLLRE